MPQRGAMRDIVEVVLAGVLSLALYEYLKVQPWDLAAGELLFDAHSHFRMVTFAAVLAGIVALAVGVIASRQRNVQVSLVAHGFTALGLLFALHGLATGGVLLDRNPLPGIATQLAITVTAVWLVAASSVRCNHCLQMFGRWQVVVLGVWTLVLAAFVLAVLRYPHLAEYLPVTSSPLRWLFGTVTVGLYVIVIFRFLRSYGYSGFPMHKAIALAAAFLLVTEWIVLTSQLPRLSWWLYHFLVLAAVVSMVAGVVRQYALGSSLAESLGFLFGGDPVRRVEQGLSDSVRALIVALEARDTYTAGHSYRVTRHALRLAQELGLPRSSLFALGQGGMVHDVGKIEVPDQVLNKPGPLTPEERQLIQRHPVSGFQMCSRLGFMRDELDVIRYHHERWDGGSYPDGLQGEKIPLLARILAIADVYDALTSRRSYREAWSHDQARQYVLDQAGSQFDPHLVEVWGRITAAGPGVFEQFRSAWPPQLKLRRA